MSHAVLVLVSNTAVGLGLDLGLDIIGLASRGLGVGLTSWS